tara:strand:- start:425 stop:766 length:342 start_codon:yes stop_codon:yes gene_type:complete
MITTISKEEAIKELCSDDYASWSYEAAAAIYDYLEDLEDDCGIVTVFNVTEIRCEFSEYKSLEKFNEQFHGPGKESEHFTLEELRDRTTVLTLEYFKPLSPGPGTDGLVIADF